MNALMKLNAIVVSIFGALLISACASAPTSQAPIPIQRPGSAFSLAHSTQLDQTSHMLKHLNAQKNVIYFQNFGGGGAALGVLLGPIGVAANIKAIDSKTTAEAGALQSKIKIDPVQAFKVAATESGAAIKERPDTVAPRGSPYLYVVKIEPDRLAIAAGLIVESPTNKPPAKKDALAEPEWRRKYMYQLPGAYSPTALASLDEKSVAQLGAAVQAGFKAILVTISREGAASVAAERKLQYKSNFLSPRFDLQLTGTLVGEDKSIVWIRDPTGVYAVRRTSFVEVGKPTKK